MGHVHSPEVRERMFDGAATFFEIELPAFATFVLDRDRLRASRVPLTTVVGKDNLARVVRSRRALVGRCRRRQFSSRCPAATRVSRPTRRNSGLWYAASVVVRGRADNTTMKGRRALIVGAGIAGLAAARALHRAGFAVDVIERERTRSTEGAGIYLPGNAARALRAFGLEDAVLAGGIVIPRRVSAIIAAGDAAGGKAGSKPEAVAWSASSAARTIDRLQARRR